MINTGANVKSVSKRLGHSKVSTTLNTYTHSMDASDQESANSLNETFLDIKKGQTLKVK
ncbi:MAG: hypothetical protein ACRCSG_09940 [Cellulosilyticaceae bacterium]